jgi:hypothetical protein
MDALLWRQNIKDAVEEAASKDIQKTAWAGGGDLVSSPDELYCVIFDDCLIVDFLESNPAQLTDEQISLGKDFVKALNWYSPDGQTLPGAIDMMRDPRWEKVRVAAALFLKSLD